MKKIEHINLHHYAVKKEIYFKLQEHYNRDTKIHSYWHIVFLVSAFGGIIYAENPDWIWLFAGIYSLERALSSWIDNSNRNWFMHTIDWIESNSKEYDDGDDSY